jgi:hypothetical protein
LRKKESRSEVRYSGEEKKLWHRNFSSIKSFNICISVRIGFPIVQREPLKELQDEIFDLRFIRHFAPSLKNKYFYLNISPFRCVAYSEPTGILAYRKSYFFVCLWSFFRRIFLCQTWTSRTRNILHIA